MGFTAIGGMALFSGIAGAIGTFATGVVVSAVVGAAVGGIASAVMGGDIGKGMLFGAIGGVVTGGIAGGQISSLFTGAAPTGTAGTGMTYGGQGTIASIGGSSPTTAVATTTTGSGAESGSFVKDMALAMAPEAVKAVGAGMLAGADKKGQATPQKQTAVRSGGGGGGGSSGPSLADQLALMEAEDKGKMARLIKEGEIGDRQIGLKSEAAIKEMSKDYALAKDKSAFEFGQEWDKQKATAAGAAASEYQTGAAAYEAVLAAQKARGDAGSGRENTQTPSGGEEALLGPVEEEAMAY